MTTAKASIYAVRFVFNCIFAFTDSEIRNSTMAAGLSVQAATLGIVPYQVVQIVLQLALAAAESAIDLSAMNHGLSVAVIKTRDTWALSMTGLKNAATDALEYVANTAAQMATDKAVNMVKQATSAAVNGLNDIVGATAEELKSGIHDLQTKMTDAAEGVLESVADEILTALLTEIEEGLNALQYVKVGNTEVGEILDAVPKKEDVLAQAEALFSQVSGNIHSKINTIWSDNAGNALFTENLKTKLTEQVDIIITDVKTETINVINSVEDVDITEQITKKLTELKLLLVEKGNSFVEAVTGELGNAATQAVEKSSEQLENYIERCGETLTEEAAAVIEQEISSFTDSFVENTLKVKGTQSASSDVKSSVVSMFQFGYKDYLMLLTYISICTSDNVLLRTADVIQMNIQNAGAGAKYRHEANTEDGGQFLMSEAYTYVSVSASADLDMFFMDLGLFQNLVSEDQELPDGADATEEAVDSEEDAGADIEYQGILGY